MLSTWNGKCWSLILLFVAGRFVATTKGIAVWCAARQFVYTSAFSTHIRRNSGLFSEIHTWRHEEPSFRDSETVSYAGGTLISDATKPKQGFVIYTSFARVLSHLYPKIFVQMDMSSVMSSILENQAELIKEVKSLRKENQQLRDLLGS